MCSYQKCPFSTIHFEFDISVLLFVLYTLVVNHLVTTKIIPVTFLLVSLAHVVLPQLESHLLELYRVLKIFLKKKQMAPSNCYYQVWKSNASLQ